LSIDITANSVLRAIAVIKNRIILVNVIETGSATKNSTLPEQLWIGGVTPLAIHQQIFGVASKDCVYKEGLTISVAIKIQFAVDK
jgi:hypothetical protein